MSSRDTGTDVSQRNHLECQCPDCDRAKMNGTPFCIKCYTENCKGENVYSDGEARCA